MAVTSFIDNNSRLGRAFLERDYVSLGQEIVAESNQYTFCMEENNSLYAFDVKKNESLSKIYHDDFFVIRLIFKDVDTLHSKQQEECCLRLLSALKQYMDEHSGYYNLRVPTHIVDLIRAYNMLMENEMFCGGTVEWIGSGKTIELKPAENVSVFWADSKYIKDKKERLLQISYESFKAYQGQYHISTVTDVKAGNIYEEWLANGLSDYKNNVIVVANNDEPIAFVMCGEEETSVEAVVGAVDNTYRQYGAYRLMISFAVNYATEKKKDFITSTQFDNFIVQGVWASLGLKPFYSIYNIHLDKRRKS